jgi:prepilin-type processing-associated H-X9-DG protein
VICADGGATADNFCTGTLAYPDLCHLECAGPGDWEADWENCPWSRACGAIGAMKTDPGLRKPYARHYGGVNIGFLDGHARWMHSEAVIAEAPSHGDRNRGRLRGFGPWGPTSDVDWYDYSDGVPPLY